MSVIITPSRAKSIGELHRFIMDWELRMAEHAARHNEYVQHSVKVAALKKMMTAEMAERYIYGHNTYPEQGEVEGEAEGSEDQIDAKRREVDTSKRTREAAPPLGRHEKREADNKQDNAKNQKKKKRASDCARHLQISPPKLLTRKATRMRSRRRRVMCVASSGNVNSMVQATRMMTSWEWDGSQLNKASGRARGNSRFA